MKKKWVWILVAGLAVCVIALLAVAAAGIYFVSSHVSTGHSTSADAFRAFDTVKATFKDQRPLFELDQREEPRATRQLTNLPTSFVKPQDLWILAWNPAEERLIKMSLPFWILKMGRRKIDLVGGAEGFDLDRLNLDLHELERVGPALVFDVRTSSGERVLIWTQ